MAINNLARLFDIEDGEEDGAAESG